MRAIRLQIDTRGRVLLPPALRAATGLVPGVKLQVAVEDGVLAITPGEAAERGRQPTLDRKGRLTLPGQLRKSLNLPPGTVLLLRVEPPALRLVTPGRLLGRLKAARLALTEALRD